MEFNIMASRSIHSSNHLSTLHTVPLHSSADNHYSVIHLYEDHDGHSYFLCPFCDFEIQLPLLCTHFQQDFCSSSALNNMVCPVCEENLGNNAFKQFTNSSSRKWGWKTENSSNSAMFGKKLATKGNKQESIPDPLLSTFVCNVPIPNSKSNHPVENLQVKNKDIDIHNAKRFETDSVEQDQQERRLRASFVQKMILSTIFEEICS